MFTKVNQCGFKLVSRLEHVHGILEQVKNISKNACKASGAFCPFPIALLLLPLRPLHTLPQKDAHCKLVKHLAFTKAINK